MSRLRLLAGFLLLLFPLTDAAAQGPVEGGAFPLRPPESVVEPADPPLAARGRSTSPADASHRPEWPLAFAARERSRAYWIAPGLGAGSRGLAGALSGSYQFGSNLLSVRGAGTVALFGDELWDIGLLYGRATRPGVVHLSLAAGVALAGGMRRSEGSIFDPQERIPATVGLPLEVQASLRLLPLVGLGLYGFGNLNREESFAGVAAAVQIGRLR